MDKKGIPPEVLAMLGVVAVVFLIVGVILFLIKIFFCLTMAKALGRCSEHNRDMQPGMAWLFLIPCLDIIWFYFLAIQVPASLQKEFEERDRDDGGDYGKSMGLTAAIIFSVMIVLNCIPFVQYCNAILIVIFLIFWIIFWVKVASYSGKLGD